MARTVILHGTNGSPEGNWFPWLSSELRSRGFDVLVPRLPTPQGQSLASWFSVFEEQVPAVDSSTTIIGHSLGATFLLRLLEQARAPIARAVFVAGLIAPIGIEEYDRLNSSFIDGTYNWSAIRRNARTFLCLSGDNDPYVPQAQGLELASRLGVEGLIVPGGGHLNGESGYSSFPLLLEKIIDAEV